MEPEPLPTPERLPEPTPDATPLVAGVPLEIPVAPTSPIPAAPAYVDRSTGLMIFGVLQILLGLLAALMVPLMALSAFMSRLAPGGAAMRPSQYVSASATYIFAAAVLLTLGIGSLQKKRWARALTLVISWYWLITGVLITVLLTAVLPVMMRSLLRTQAQAAGSAPGDMPTGVMAVILTIVIVFAAFFLIVVPASQVVFYSRKDVAQTCQHRDPVERWTDRAPLPVLGASIVFFTGAIYLILVGVTTPMFPLFGQYLTGIRGVTCFLVVAALDLYLAVGLFRLKSFVWWLAVITVPVRLLSMALTYGMADPMQAYSRLGWSDSQLHVLSASPIFHSHVILWWSLASMVILFGYLLWLKRYFNVPEAPPQTEALTAEVG